MISESLPLSRRAFVAGCAATCGMALVGCGGGTVHGSALGLIDSDSVDQFSTLSEALQTCSTSRMTLDITPTDTSAEVTAAREHRAESRSIARLLTPESVAVIGASPGGFGTILAQNAWWPVLRTLGTRPFFGGRLMVSRAGKAFDAEGTLVDDAVRESLRGFLDGFARFAAG